MKSTRPETADLKAVMVVGQVRTRRTGRRRCTVSSALLVTALFLFLFGAGSIQAAKTPGDKVLLERADRARKALLSSPARMKYRHHWERCIRLYDRVYKRYPRSDSAPWALYRSARLLTGLYRYSGSTKDLDEALKRFKRVVERYPQHRLADDAQFRIGEIFYKEKNDLSSAYVEFLKLDIKFPSGDMRPRAQAMLDRLASVISRKEEARLRKEARRRGAVHVKDIRHWSTPNYTRVVVDLDAPVKYTSRLLKPDPRIKKPGRLYLDLRHARVSKDIDSHIPIKDGLLKAARAAQHSPDSVRVVLDMESVGGYKIFHLYDPFRIVVDVRRSAEKRKAGPSRAERKRKPRKGIRRADTSPPPVSLAGQLGLSVKRIVIDPGHGGRDPGCRGPGGLLEKHIVLRLAKILAARIRKEVGCEVFLTRTRDVFVPLERRTAIANMKKADLFISLHVNAHRNRRIHGLETYFLNMATDKRAVLVAARENATSEKNISDLQAILNDLMLNTKIHESNRLALKVHAGMVSQVKKKYKKVRDLGVKQAPFYVLIGAEMPAVLVETGFLTNPVEARRLTTKTYMAQMAAGISRGIKSYIDSIDQVYRGG